MRPTEPDPEVELARLRAQLTQSAHDLSNALGAVLNYATFLDEDLAVMPEAAHARAYVPHLEHAARRALRVVERLASDGTA